MHLFSTLVVHLAVTWYMVGLIWFVQRVHYPLMAYVSTTDYETYHRKHVRLTGWVVGPAMGLEALTSVLLVSQLDGTLLALGWRAFSLLVLIWLVTALFSVPAHTQLAHRFDSAIHRRLVLTNWIRTVAWTLRGVLALLILLEARTESALG